jgi:hypothetical protein
VPQVAWYGAVRLVDRAADALPALLASEDAEGRRFAAVVERADVPPAAAAAIDALAARPPDRPLHAGRVVDFAPDRVAVEIDAPADGLVVLNESHFPGWRVTVDGAPATPLRANYLLRAVAVPAGPHRIVWTFEPPRYRAMLALWAAGALFVLAAIAVPRRRRGAA